MLTSHMNKTEPYIRQCPVKTAMRYLGKRWTFEIIRDLMFKNRRYSEFLGLNKGLSTKVLSQRLKELESAGLVYKRILSKTPLKIEYELTSKGRRLDRVFYEIALFSYEFHKEEIFEDEPLSQKDMEVFTKNLFLIK